MRDIIAMGARPVALLDGLRFADGDARFDRAVAGIGAYGNSVGVPTVGGEAGLRRELPGQRARERDVRRAPARRPRHAGGRDRSGQPRRRLRRHHGTRRDRRRVGAREPGATEDDADKRPSVQVGGPVHGGKRLIEVSVELVESGPRRVAAGLWRRRAAPPRSGDGARLGIDLRLDQVPLGGGDGALGGDDLGEPERMVAVVRPAMLDAVLAVCDRWELHRAVIGEVTDTGLLRALWHDEVVGEIPARLLTDECPRYTVEPVPRSDATSSAAEPRTHLATRRRCSSCSPRRTSGAARRSTAATTTSSARARCAGRGWTRPCSACGPATEGSRSRSTAPAGWAGSTRVPAVLWRCSRRRGMSLHRRRADRLHRLPQLRQPGEGPRSRGTSPRRSKGWRLPARRSVSRSSPATSPSTTRPMVARSTRRPSSAASVCSRTCDSSSGVAQGDVILLAGASPVALAGSEYRPLRPDRRPAGASRPGRGGFSRRVPLAGGAAVLARARRLARRARRRARRGGGALGHRRRAELAGRRPRLVRGGGRPGGPRLRAGRGRPARRRAAPAPGLVAGSQLLGHTVDELREAYT